MYAPGIHHARATMHVPPCITLAPHHVPHNTTQPQYTVQYNTTHTHIPPPPLYLHKFTILASIQAIQQWLQVWHLVNDSQYFRCIHNLAFYRHTIKGYQGSDHGVKDGCFIGKQLRAEDVGGWMGDGRVDGRCWGVWEMREWMGDVGVDGRCGCEGVVWA